MQWSTITMLSSEAKSYQNKKVGVFFPPFYEKEDVNKK